MCSTSSISSTYSLNNSQTLRIFSLHNKDRLVTCKDLIHNGDKEKFSNVHIKIQKVLQNILMLLDCLNKYRGYQNNF